MVLRVLFFLFFLSTCYAQVPVPKDFRITNSQDSTIHGTGWRLHGSERTEWAGFAVSGGYDINNDGFDDLVIGSYKIYDSLGKNGRVYILFGTSDPVESVDVSLLEEYAIIFEGDQNDHLGIDVELVPDLNGDGYADAIMTAADASIITVMAGDGPDNTISNCGEVYILFGREVTEADFQLGVIPVSDLLYGDDNSNAEIGVVLYGEAPQNAAGEHVASIGDINNDGIGDLSISAFQMNLENRGGIYVVFGRAGGWNHGAQSLSDAADLKFLLMESNDHHGAVLMEAGGDLNDDGHVDMIIGVQKAMSMEAGANEAVGEVYVLFGMQWTSDSDTVMELAELAEDSTRMIVLKGTTENNFCGRSVAVIPRTSSNDVDTLLIGCDGDNTLGAKTGAVFLVTGRSTSAWGDITGQTLDELSETVSNDVIKLVGAAAGGQLGKSVYNLGDVTNDNKSDFVLGAQRGFGSCGDIWGGYKVGDAVIVHGLTALHNVYAGDNSGHVYDINVLKDTQISGTRTWIAGPSSESLLGHIVRSAGDFNGDGYNDLVVTAYKDDTSGISDSGSVSILFGPFGEESACPAIPVPESFAPLHMSTDCETESTPVNYCDDPTHCYATCDEGYENAVNGLSGLKYNCHWNDLGMWSHHDPADIETDIICVLIDDCASSPCNNGGECTDTGVQSFSCECPGFTGPTCDEPIDECASSPCIDGGECTDLVLDYSCDCSGTQFTGPRCEYNIDDCISSPCENGGLCYDNGWGLFGCDCTETGFVGKTCQVDVDECLSDPCQNDAPCENDINGYTCDCVWGYTGRNCDVDVNECASSPCLHNGLCSETDIGAYVCDCEGTGYNGELCEIEIDECVSCPCENGGTCTDVLLDFSCECDSAYSGIRCEIDIDDCESGPCQNGGVCADTGPHSYNCDCTGTGFDGLLCEHQFNDCASGNCMNGGTCHDLTGGFYCDCAFTFTGDLCATDMDPCVSSPCLNTETCLYTEDAFECVDTAGLNSMHGTGFYTMTLASVCPTVIRASNTTQIIYIQSGSGFDDGATVSLYNFFTNQYTYVPVVDLRGARKDHDTQDIRYSQLAFELPSGLEHTWMHGYQSIRVRNEDGTVQTCRDQDDPLDENNCLATDTIYFDANLTPSCDKLEVLMDTNNNEVFVDSMYETEQCSQRIDHDIWDGYTCVSCPEHAMCVGGGRVWPMEGYYSYSETAMKLTRCNVPASRCAGGYGYSYTDRIFQSACAQGYVGEFCSLCDLGYFADPVLPGTCVSCDADNVVFLVAAVLMILLLVILLGGVFWFEDHTMLFKASAASVFIQQLSLGFTIVTANLEKADRVRGLTAIFRMVAPVSVNVLALRPECWLDPAEDAVMHYSEQFLLALALIIIVLLLTLISGVAHTFRTMQPRAHDVVFGVLDLTFGPAYIVCLRMLSCKTVPVAANTQESRLALDLSTECWSGVNVFFQLIALAGVIVLMCIVVWYRYQAFKGFGTTYIRRHWEFLLHGTRQQRSDYRIYAHKGFTIILGALSVALRTDVTVASFIVVCLFTLDTIVMVALWPMKSAKRNGLRAVMSACRVLVQLTVFLSVQADEDPVLLGLAVSFTMIACILVTVKIVLVKQELKSSPDNNEHATLEEEEDFDSITLHRNPETELQTMR